MKILSMNPAEDELDARAYLARLCESIQMTTPHGIDVSFKGVACPLATQTCQYLGMIVSELIQTARQHAFPDGRGNIKVELTNNDAAANCRIADNGRGYAENKCARAMTIVHALAGHLQATLARSSGPGGTTWIVTVPRRYSKLSRSPLRAGRRGNSRAAVINQPVL